MSLYEDEQGPKRLHYELERMIKQVNNREIGELNGTISFRQLVEVSSSVARLRARYLQSVLALPADNAENAAEAARACELKQLREAYCEAQQGFAAIEHALDRGYIELVDRRSER